jgi:hypothetical protein
MKPLVARLCAAARIALRAIAFREVNGHPPSDGVGLSEGRLVAVIGWAFTSRGAGVSHCPSFSGGAVRVRDQALPYRLD